MMGDSAGRSRRNPQTGEERSTPRQRKKLTVPPGVEVESAEDRVLWWKIVCHMVLWVGGLAAVVVLHNGWDWIGLSCLMLSGAAMGAETRWRAPTRRTTRTG